jgi:hypothetical protein
MTLDELLTIDPRLRKSTDYEAMYTTFVLGSGGFRVEDRLSIPEGTRNADYWFEFEDIDLLVELKQIAKYDATQTVDLYFTDLIRRGKVRDIDRTVTGEIQITPNSLSNTQWRHFYEKFKPAVEGALKGAASQIRETAGLIGNSRRKVGGVVLLNTGDYNLSTDLLFRLCEYKIRKEWKVGSFRSVDFVSCHTVDFAADKSHPLHSRHIVKSMSDEQVVAALLHLHQSWLSFVGAAIGFEARITQGTIEEAPSINFNSSFPGKIKKLQM